MMRNAALLGGILLLGIQHGQSQGVIAFSVTRPILDNRIGGVPPPPETLLAGIYYTTDLTASPDLWVAQDAFQLIAVSAVTPIAILPGIVFPRQVIVNGVHAGVEVLVQVRAWSVGYDNYGSALLSGDPNIAVGGSNVGHVTLGGGGTIPIPSTSMFLESFAVNGIPEPSTLALGLLGGLSGLLLMRRRRAALQSRSG